MTTKEILSMNLKYYRKKYNLSQEKFAGKVGSNLVYINELEQCKRKPTIDMLEKIADGINKNNLIHDTRIDRVLISFHYWYFGENAIELPKEFTEAIATGRAYKKLQNNICADITSWVGNYYEMGQHGLPYKWKKFGQFVRFEGEKQ